MSATIGPAQYTPYRAGMEPLYEPDRAWAEPEPEPTPIPAPSRIQSLAVLAVFTAAYAVLGAHVITVNHVVVFDAIDRLARAYMVWWNAPPKLAAIGFSFPPVASLVFLPVAAVKPLATSLIGLALTSAFFAGLTMSALNAVLARCQMPTIPRLLVLVLFGLNPLWAFYASNGTSEVVSAYFFTAAIGGFIAWYLTDAARFLIGGGIAAALLALTRYDLGTLSLVLAMMITAVLIRRRSERPRVEGTVMAFLAPVVYCLVLWTMFNLLIVGKPFSWLGSSTSLAVNSDQIAQHLMPTFSSVAGHVGEILVSVAPIAILAFALLLLVFLSQASTIALSLAAVVALTVILLGAGAFIHHDLGQITLGASIPILLAGVIGAGWAYRAAGGLRLVVLLAIAGVLAISIPLAWSRMQSYPYQDQEQAFVRGLSSGKDQTGTSSRGGFRVGVDPERQMAAYINRHVGQRTDAVLADNSQTFGVILLGGRPQVIFDRVDKGDAVWRAVRDDPYGRVSYILIATQTAGDLIRQRYPNAASGGNEPFLTPVFTTTPARYTLVQVASIGPNGPRRRSSTSAAGNVQTGNSTPSAATTATTTTSP